MTNFRGVTPGIPAPADPLPMQLKRMNDEPSPQTEAPLTLRAQPTEDCFQFSSK